MRWFRRGPGRQPVQHDTGVRDALLNDVRTQFGGAVMMRFADQAETVSRMLAGDDGLAVAAEVLRQSADAAHAELSGQVTQLHQRTGYWYAVDRRNYRPLLRDAAAHLRWPMFELRSGFHPYAQIAGAVAVIDAGAKRLTKVSDAAPVLDHLFELLDLTAAGWEFFGVPVDTDAAALAGRLIAASRALHDAMGDPPPIALPIRELMRRNNTLQVYEPGSGRPLGTFNPGQQMREVLLT
ncbi:hypothetical protein Acsp02_00350 [Actinoplanes sp. NBRC 103695]|nr:hypothetical protein Acsp02_00350 [Actinoplanes sp. NBRC 103695]